MPGVARLAPACSPAAAGIWLVAAAAAAFNCLVEQGIDAQDGAHRLAARPRAAS